MHDEEKGDFKPKSHTHQTNSIVTRHTWRKAKVNMLEKYCRKIMFSPSFIDAADSLDPMKETDQQKIYIICCF